jgi:hypothetical protein
MVQLSFKIFAFTILLNLAVGLMIYIGTAGGVVDNIFSMEGNIYNSDQTSPFTTEMEKTINSAPVESSSNFGEKILDFFSIGLYSKIKSFLHDSIFALPNMLTNAGLITPGLSAILNGILSVIYINGIFQLFTGKIIWGEN